MEIKPQPDYVLDPARETLSGQISRVSNLEEVLEARAALRTWMQKYPQDVGMVDGSGEMLYMLEDCYRGIAAEEALMTEEEQVYTRTRHKLGWLVRSPMSMAEVEEAEQGLHQWLCEHPDDEEMRGLYPTLAMFREMYEILTEGNATAGEAARHGAAAPELAAR